MNKNNQTYLGIHAQNMLRWKHFGHPGHAVQRPLLANRENVQKLVSFSSYRKEAPLGPNFFY